MSRPTHAERGARLAASQAVAILEAHLSPDQLFPLRLQPAEVDLWAGILDAADECSAEHRFLREAMRA